MTDIVNLLEEKEGKTVDIISVSKDFLNRTSIVQQMGSYKIKRKGNSW